MTHETGRCLCGKVSYEVTSKPLWVTVCFCHFCQRATGSQGLVEPIFDRPDFAITSGEPRCYTHVSTGSGKNVFVHFCGDCGTLVPAGYKTFRQHAAMPDGTPLEPEVLDEVLHVR